MENDRILFGSRRILSVRFPIGSDPHVPLYSRQFLDPEPIYRNGTRFQLDSRL
jgi:hypothetical protein